MTDTLDPIDASVEELLDVLNPKVFGASSRIGFRWVRWADVKEQDLNANVMPPEMFNALVTNIRKAGVMESVPLTANREGGEVIELVSGHHRKRAAMEAGKEYGIVLHYHGLTESEIRAKQLAHNSIAGSSDPQIVAEIFQQIEGLDLQMEAYIDPAILEKVPDALSFKPVDLDPLAHARTVTVVFLPTQCDDFTRAMDLLADKPDTVYLAARESFDGFREAVHRVRKELDIHSIPSAIAKMSRIVQEHLDTIEGGQDAVEQGEDG